MKKVNAQTYNKLLNFVQATNSLVSTGLPSLRQPISKALYIMKRQASKKTAFIAGIMFSLLLLLSEVIKESFELPESIEGLGFIFLIAIVFYSKQISFKSLIDTCKVDFPSLESNLSNSYNKWSANNERILTFTDEIVAQAKIEVPHVVENMSKAGLAAISNVYDIMSSETQKGYCNQHIEKLSNGEWDFKAYKPDYFKVIDNYLKTR